MQPRKKDPSYLDNNVRMYEMTVRVGETMIHMNHIHIEDRSILGRKVTHFLFLKLCTNSTQDQTVEQE